MTASTRNKKWRWRQICKLHHWSSQQILESSYGSGCQQRSCAQSQDPDQHRFSIKQNHLINPTFEWGAESYFCEAPKLSRFPTTGRLHEHQSVPELKTVSEWQKQMKSTYERNPLPRAPSVQGRDRKDYSVWNYHTNTEASSISSALQEEQTRRAGVLENPANTLSFYENMETRGCQCSKGETTLKKKKKRRSSENNSHMS